jgi:hypothetical protein
MDEPWTRSKGYPLIVVIPPRTWGGREATEMAPDRGTDALLWLLHFLFYRWVASVVHEAAHLLALMIATGHDLEICPSLT